MAVSWTLVARRTRGSGSSTAARRFGVTFAGFAAPLAMAIIAELIRRGRKMGYEWAELGWTLEDNRLINAAIQSVGAKIYKRYRLYEKPIGA